jgi:chromate reductase
VEVLKMKSKSFEVAVLIGSLRKKSFNRMLVHAMMGLEPDRLRFKIVEIGDLPFYNDDLEADTPAPWKAVRDTVASADAVLFATPEYNRSVPAALKNAVDVLSRPFGNSALIGKPAAVATASPGNLGGFGANHHLRQSLVCLGVNVMPAPEFYLSGVASVFNDEGAIINTKTAEFMTKFLNEFSRWTALFSRE